MQPRRKSVNNTDCESGERLPWRASVDKSATLNEDITKGSYLTDTWRHFMHFHVSVGTECCACQVRLQGGQFATTKPGDKDCYWSYQGLVYRSLVSVIDITRDMYARESGHIILQGLRCVYL